MVTLFLLVAINIEFGLLFENNVKYHFYYGIYVNKKKTCIKNFKSIIFKFGINYKCLNINFS